MVNYFMIFTVLNNIGTYIVVTITFKITILEAFDMKRHS